METTLYLILNFCLELRLILLSNVARLVFGVPIASMVRGVTLPDCLYMTRKESHFCFMYVSFAQFVPGAYACTQNTTSGFGFRTAVHELIKFYLIIYNY